VTSIDLATGLLVPVYAAAELYEGPDSAGFDPVGRGFAATAAVGFGVFSRGRELAADRAAATATGDPAAHSRPRSNDSTTRTEGRDRRPTSAITSWRRVR